jgi:hypothetical protein
MGNLDELFLLSTEQEESDAEEEAAPACHDEPP